MTLDSEVIAQAIFKSHGAQRIDSACSGVPWGDLPEHHAAHYSEMAKAAREVFLGPTLNAIDAAVEMLRERLPSLTDEQRSAVFEAIQDGYCKHCGSVSPSKRGVGCFCQRDD
jgi:hypothetical protein